MSPFLCLFYLGLSATLITLTHAAPQSLRGIDPEKLSLYTPKAYCLRTKERIPSSRINDGYCDCVDGSDEPGTSACSHMDQEAKHFYCPNVGHIPALLYSSQVDDGVCDCCDGSDEALRYSSLCRNTCATEAVKHDAEKVQREQQRLLGLTARELLVSRAKEIRVQKEAELVSNKTVAVALHEEIVSLEEARRTEEALESIEREKIYQRSLKQKAIHDAKFSEEKKKDGKGEEADAETMPMVKPLPCVGWRQSGSCIPDEMDFPEESSCDTLIVPLAQGSCECEDPTLEEIFVYFPFECGHPALTCAKVCRYQGLPKVAETDQDRVKEYLELQYFKIDDGSSYERPSAKAAREALKIKESEKREIDRKVSEIEAQLAQVYGPGDSFLALRDECFLLETSNNEYTYRLCMFKNIVQKNQRTGTEAILGKWKAFGEREYSSWGGGADFSVGNYSDGGRCWSGPTRSTTVHHVCGPTNAVLEVKEPSMCTYSMTFQTPAVCE